MVLVGKSLLFAVNQYVVPTLPQIKNVNTNSGNGSEVVSAGGRLTGQWTTEQVHLKKLLIYQKFVAQIANWTKTIKW